MSKFNKSTKTPATRAESLVSHKDAVLNHEGALAFKLDDHMDLYIRVASCMVGEKKFYEKAEQADAELLASIRRVLAVDPEFVLQLALYARNVLNLRSVPLVLLTEFANTPHAEVVNASKYVAAAIQRADELTELTALQFRRNKNVEARKALLPMVLKRGMKQAFGKFDEYRLSKYNREGDVKLKDVFYLVRPSQNEEIKMPALIDVEKAPRGEKRAARAENEELMADYMAALKDRETLYDRVANDQLAIPVTWETMRSAGEPWHRIINEVFYKNGRTNNYMALLRNLRNILTDKTVTTADVALVCRMLTDEKAVEHSRQFPFRYLSTYKALLGYKYVVNEEHMWCREWKMEPIVHPMMGDVLDALECAAEYSLSNLPRLEGTTYISCDTSGSMMDGLSKNSSVARQDVGMMLGAIAHKFCDRSIMSVFGTDHAVVNLAKYSSGMLANVIKMEDMNDQVGSGTEGWKIIDYLDTNDLDVDRIMVFTDLQMWSDTNRFSSHTSARYMKEHFGARFLDYQRRHRGVKLYLFDVSGYANMVLPQGTKNVCLIGGWNERVFDFIPMFEKTGAQGGVIQKIRATRP